jgi:DNA-binding NtrC family response regulator
VEDTPTFSTLSGDDERRLGGVKPRAQLYVVLDCDRPCAAPSRHTLEEIDEVLIGRGSERHATRVRDQGKKLLKISIPDRRTSREHARLSRNGAGWVLEDLESKNGSVLNGQRVAGQRRLGHGDLIELGHTFLLFHDNVPTATHDAADEVAVGAGPGGDDGLATLNPPLAFQLMELRRLAKIDTTVAVLGETGTGKELIARAIHSLSGRPGAFVAVNCGAIPESLLESELFGYKKGAFSGALGDQVGLVQAAHAGTLFLDEVGDLPAPSQAALLRVIQEKEVRPLGGRQAERVDLRVVCATHRDLPGMVARGQFRADLWARLSGVVVRLPPLRARREDFGILFASLLRKLAPERAVELSLTRDSARAMLTHGWPLNVRELENLLRSGLGLLIGNVLDLRPVEAISVPPGGRLAGDSQPAADDDEGDDADDRDDGDDAIDTPGDVPGAPVPPELEGDLDTRRQAQIIALLRQFDGNVIAVAKAMRRSRGAIHRWIKKYGIDADRYRK